MASSCGTKQEMQLPNMQRIPSLVIFCVWREPMSLFLCLQKLVNGK